MGLAGALSGLTGTGGGFIKVPVMYSLMDVPLGVATTTKLHGRDHGRGQCLALLQPRRHPPVGGRAAAVGAVADRAVRAASDARRSVGVRYRQQAVPCSRLGRSAGPTMGAWRN